MDKKIIFLSLLPIALTSCSTNNSVIESKVFCFDTMVDVRLYEGNKEDVKAIETTLKSLSKVSDNYINSAFDGVYALNQTNEEITVDSNLYQMLEASLEATSHGATYFNPLCGSLSKKWKESLENKQILSETVINEELEKMNNSSITLKDNNVVQRTGEAEIDLGGIAKGFALDEIKSYLEDKQIKQYLINAGSSSILLGEKNTKNGLFNVSLKEVNNTYIELKNCVISTSSIYEQGVTINGVTYSHIINPVTGSAINKQDGVIVISNDGAFDDALSTSMMNNTIDEIKALETELNVQTIVIKDKKIAYSNPSIEVKHR